MRVEDFAALMQDLRPKYKKSEIARKMLTVEGRAERQRSQGGGRRFSNSLEDRVLMVLMHLRLYVSYDVLCLFFRVKHRSVICRTIQHIKPLVEACLPTPDKVRVQVLAAAQKEGARRGQRLNKLEALKAAYPELTVLIDGVEQEKQRPQDPAKRKRQYSGKKKRHTLKQVVVATPTGLILEQSPPVDGRRHDFEVLKAHPPDLLRRDDLRVTAYGDSGFQGAAKLGHAAEYRLIARARRGKPLTEDEKATNAQRSRKRIAVEHTFARRKEYKIAALKYRHKDECYQRDMNIVAGLVNLRAINRLGIAI